MIGYRGLRRVAPSLWTTLRALVCLAAITGLSACVSGGARPAMPGEFTRRAFMAGKIDLAQAEGVADLIAATGERGCARGPVARPAIGARARPRRRRRSRWFATPLFLALVTVEVADLVFAVDSVPAIFAITTDTFIVYTANIMAILGLRALYFALAAMVHRFHYLKYALALVLVFIGGKIFWNQIVGKVDPAISLGVTLAMILGGILWSLWKTRKDTPVAAQ